MTTEPVYPTSIVLAIARQSAQLMQTKEGQTKGVAWCAQQAFDHILSCCWPEYT